MKAFFAFRQRQDVKTRSGDLTTQDESEVICMKDHLGEVLKLLRIVLLCLLICLLRLLTK